jgi:transposase
MTQAQTARHNLGPIPTLRSELLYVGVDVGKRHHVAGFISRTLLPRYERFEACPSLVFEQSREGFRALCDRIQSFVPLEQAYVLLEHTGHYHRALVHYLQELDVPVYLMPVQKRPVGMLKTDKRDALSLAIHLYNQLELGVQLADKTHVVRRLLPPTDTACQLKGWMRHRYELIHECTQRKKKLIAICDELFPELTQVLKDPTAPTALVLRQHFPTPHAIASASLTALAKLRKSNRPSNEQLLELQRLACQTIGTKDIVRQRTLVLEQSQLIRELQLLQEHVQQLDSEIVKLVEQSREGQILISIPPIGPIQAAAIIAAIGNIENFEQAAALKAYFGWAPKREQSGTSLDRDQLSHSGTRTMKQMLFLIVASAIQKDCEWAKLYERLVPRMCRYDERKRAYRGKVKVMVRIAGQMTEMIYAFLKHDAELLSQVPAGTEPPAPMRYDPDIQRSHRNGAYRPLKNTACHHKVMRLPTPDRGV